MSENFNSLLHVSPLITNERLSEALTDWFKEKFSFTHWEYSGEKGRGEGTVSDMIRIKIHGVKNNGEANFIQVVIKTIPKNLARRLTCRNGEFFKNEINFFKRVLPELLKFQSQKNLKKPFDKYPKFIFGYSDGINDVLCLEDGNVQNFGSAVRQQGLDLEHCELLFKALAQFHALSFAMKDQEPERFKNLPDCIMENFFDTRLSSWYSRYWERISGIAIDAVEKEYPNSIYVEKIKQFAVPERYQDMVHAATKATENGVICHGDCWITNLLYKYVDGRPVDLKLIDFQLVRYGSPVLDISLTVYSCTDQDLRDKHYEDLLQLYYDTLSAQIKDLGTNPCKVYPWKLFKEEIKKYSYFGLGYSFDTTPFSVLPPEDAIDFDIEGDVAMNIVDVWNIGNIKTKEGRLREANNIKHCVDNGYI